jgi:hypothetical protein
MQSGGIIEQSIVGGRIVGRVVAKLVRGVMKDTPCACLCVDLVRQGVIGRQEPPDGLCELGWLIDTGLQDQSQPIEIVLEVHTAV